MTYFIGNHEFNNATDTAEYITENLGDDVFDNMLDECYDEIEICGLSYAPSIALYRVDEIAYNCARNDYYDSLLSDIVYDLERADNGDDLDFYGFIVMCVEEEEEEEEQ